MEFLNPTISVILGHAALVFLWNSMIYLARNDGFSPVGTPVESQYQSAGGAWLNMLFFLLGPMMVFSVLLAIIVGLILKVWFTTYIWIILAVCAIGDLSFFVVILVLHMLFGNWGHQSFSYTNQFAGQMAQVFPLLATPAITYLLALGAGAIFGW